ncbi:hypothetical protein Tco_0431397 [Tanacetum coccineum]
MLHRALPRVGYFAGNGIGDVIDEVLKLEWGVTFELPSGIGMENLGLLAGSERLSDKMRVLFDQSLKEEESFGTGAALDWILKMFLRELERMKVIVARDAGILAELEQLLARVHVGVGLKKGYVAELKDTA